MLTFDLNKQGKQILHQAQMIQEFPAIQHGKQNSTYIIRKTIMHS